MYNVGDGELTGALHLLVVTSTTFLSSLAAAKSGMV